MQYCHQTGYGSSVAREPLAKKNKTDVPAKAVCTYHWICTVESRWLMVAGQPRLKVTAPLFVEERVCVRTPGHVTTLHLRMEVKAAMGKPTAMPCYTCLQFGPWQSWKHALSTILRVQLLYGVFALLFWQYNSQGNLVYKRDLIASSVP